MKKLLLLFALLLTTVGVFAQVTKFYKPGERLSTLTEGQKVMFYNTCLPDGQDRTGFLTDNGSSLNLVKSKPSNSPIFSEKEGVWTIETATLADNELYYTVNVKGSNGYLGIGGKTNNANAQVMLFHKWTTADVSKRAGVGSENANGEKVNNTDISADDKVWLVTNEAQGNTWNGNQNSFATWSTGHPYAIYSVVEATTEDLNTILTTAKTTAVDELNTLKKLSEIYTTTETAIAAVNAVVLENNDLETALNLINTLVADVKAEANGKNVKLCNKSYPVNNNGDKRGGMFLGYDKANSRAAAVTDGGDAAIWTIKLNADGTFKLYNWVNNIYLGTPGAGNDNTTPVHTTANDAPSYKFIITEENEVALASGDKMVHIASHTNYKVMHYWSTTDKASLWAVTTVSEILVTHEQYNAAAAAKTTLPYAIQQAYGLVTDANNYYSNYKSDAEGSYAALLDNTESSYFHSAYGSEAGDGSGVHYIQADLGEGNSVDEFYFYMKPRSGNGNNRPKNITVYGSNDINGEFTKIADVTTTLDGSMNPYMSAKLGTEGTNYRYIRLTVTSTNSNSTFFTLSELYFLPANNDVNALIEAYKDFSSLSITSNDMVTAAEALVNAGSKLALANVKKKIDALLTANTANHAETPQLGQYSTAGYNALQAAYSDLNATEESLEAAIAAFKTSKNLPVFMITGVKDYVVGKSIYDNPDNVNAKGNTLYFKTTNIYDKTMWWALDITAIAVSAEHLDKEFALYNIGTGKDFWNSSIKLTETNENENTGIADDDIFLMYTTSDTSYPVHFQADGALMTRWGSYDAASGSAMKFVYVGNSYDLKQLPSSIFTAAAELAAITVPNFNFAPGVNNYDSSTKPALDAAIANRTDVLCKRSSAEEIAAAKSQLETAIAGVKINMPVDGKFYRLRCTADGMKYLQCTQKTATDRFDMISGDAGKTVNATFCYTNGGLVSYVNPMYIGHEGNTASWNMNPVTVLFQSAGSGEVGQYNIKLGTRYLYGKNDKSDSGEFNGEVLTNTDKGYHWWLEEVPSLPFTFKAAALGYATFNAPVAVQLPEGVKAYTSEIQEGNKLMMTELAGGIVPANTAVLLWNESVADEDVTVNLTITENVTFKGTNSFVGTVASENLNAEMDCYSLQKGTQGKVGFYAKSNGTKGGFKAWIEMAKSSEARAFVIIFDGEDATGIKEALGLENENVEIYDLSGRRLDKPAKGVNVIGGKTVIVR